MSGRDYEPRSLSGAPTLGSWEDDLLEIAAELLFGFSFNDGNGDLGTILTGVQTSLDTINHNLTNLQGQIGRIEGVLEQLPQLLTGALDKKFGSEWLKSAQIDAGHIKDKTIDLPTYEANRRAVDANVESLEKGIAQVFNFLDQGTHGTYPAILTCSLIGVWVQAKSTILNDKVLTPVPHTIREMTFYSQMKEIFQGMSGTVVSAKAEAIRTSDNTPHGNTGSWLYIPATGAFEKTTGPTDRKRQLYAGTTTTSELFGLTTDIAPGPLPFLYQVVNAGTLSRTNWVDRANVAAALNSWPYWKKRLAEARVTLKYLANSDQALAQILQVFS